MNIGADHLCPCFVSVGPACCICPAFSGMTVRSGAQVRDLTGDGHVMKRRIRDGIGEFPIDCPIEDSSVWVHYKCDWHHPAIALPTPIAPLSFC